jgi:hypothetical protein
VVEALESSNNRKGEFFSTVFCSVVLIVVLTLAVFVFLFTAVPYSMAFSSAETRFFASTSANVAPLFVALASTTGHILWEVDGESPFSACAIPSPDDLLVYITQVRIYVERRDDTVFFKRNSQLTNLPFQINIYHVKRKMEWCQHTNNRTDRRFGRSGATVLPVPIVLLRNLVCPKVAFSCIIAIDLEMSRLYRLENP